MAIEHTLTDVDSIQGLAAKYGITWAEIADYNGLEYPYFLTSNQAVETLYASGFITVTRGLYTSSLTIMKNSTFTTEVDAQGIVKTYAVVEDTVIPAGSPVGYLYVRCVSYGTFGNVIASAIVVAGTVNTNLGVYGGFTDIRNELPIDNGTDAKVLVTGQTVYLPADSALGTIEGSESISTSEVLTAIGGIDYALAEDGDLEDDGFGDIGTHVGVENIAQSVNHRLRTRRGSLPKHLSYGSNLHTLIGKAYLPYINKLVELDIIDTLGYDDRLGEVSLNTVSLAGTSVYVDLTVTVVGTSATINVKGNFGSTTITTS
jgi:hypothetical protein